MAGRPGEDHECEEDGMHAFVALALLLCQGAQQDVKYTPQELLKLYDAMQGLFKTYQRVLKVEEYRWKPKPNWLPAPGELPY
jgi:hypothetical protein